MSKQHWAEEKLLEKFGKYGLNLRENKIYVKFRRMKYNEGSEIENNDLIDSNFFDTVVSYIDDISIQVCKVFVWEIVQGINLLCYCNWYLFLVMLKLKMLLRLVYVYIRCEF